MKLETYQEKLKGRIDKFVHLVYKTTKSFPKEELFGITSQLRRASISVMLNYIEGYARGKDKVHKNFLEISYGSLKECKYLLYFSYTEKYLEEKSYKELPRLSEEIGAMLWGIIKKLS